MQEALKECNKALALFLVEVQPALLTCLQIIQVPLAGSLDPLICVMVPSRTSWI